MELESETEWESGPKRYCLPPILSVSLNGSAFFSLYTFCFSLYMVKHGSSAAFSYNHNWRWIDCLWIPLFSFLERIWRTELESNIHILCQGKWFYDYHIWGFEVKKKKKRYNFTDKGSSCELRETPNGPYTKAVWLFLSRAYL